jgi:NADPH:quinone reductase-like Zn-dependent oxidoreductase
MLFQPRYTGNPVMKAVYIERHGGNEVLRFGQLPRPVPGSGEVLVRVRAAAVNPRDWMVRSGTYPFRVTLPSFPVILGGDFAGEVAGAGPGVERFVRGERVYGMQRAFGGFGAFAQYVVAKQDLLARIPEGLDAVHAAAVPLAALTAWQGLHGDARIRAGESVLVNGAAGGVGSFAVQLAVAAGARVTGVSSTRNLDFVRDLGAGDVIDYTSEDFLSRGRRWNVIFDAIGKASFSECRTSLSEGGRYVTTVPKRSDIMADALGRLTAPTLPRRPRCRLILARSSGERLEAVSGLIGERRVVVPVEAVYELDQAGEALARSRTFHTRGKLVLRVP